MTTCLITGGAGFVGATLVRKLLAEGKRVIVYDNFSFGRRENIDLDDEKLTIVEGEIVDQDSLRQIVEQYQPQTVFHLAALHFIPYCNQHPGETLRVNTEGTQALLESCRGSSVQKILAASSAAVYPPSDLAYTEDHDVGFFDIYGASKIFTENLLNMFCAETGMAGVALRFFNIYGPYETNPHLIPRIMEQFVSGAASIELGNLTPKRDYIFVEDVAEAVMALAADAGATSGAFNIGTGREYAVTEIVDILNTITGRRVEVKSLEKYRRKVDREHLLSDAARIKSQTGWAARFSIEEGLRKTAEFYNLVPAGAAT